MKDDECDAGKIEEREIREFADLAKEASAVKRAFFGLDAWYRGQARASWKLVPLLWQTKERDWERTVLRRFQLQAHARYADCPEMTDSPGWLTLARHYGLPTRLLDWTESILVAAFFAVSYEREEHEGEDAAIWALDPGGLNLSQTQERQVGALHHEHAGSLAMEAFQDAGPRDQVIAACPAQIDLRVLVQQSVFTIHGSAKPLEKYPQGGSFLRKLVIPADARESIVAALLRCGIRLAALFPDLSHLTEELKLIEVFQEPLGVHPTPDGPEDSVKPAGLDKPGAAG